MSSPWSVIGQCAKQDVRLEPFEHLVRDGALEPDRYDELARTFPSMSRFTDAGVTLGANQAVRIPARVVLSDSSFGRPWQEFFAYHTSQAFWDDIVSIYGDAIRGRHPHLEEQVGRPMQEWTAKLRGTDGDADVALDALFVINTPSSRKSSVRPAHVDYERKIFAGLFYMRTEDDDTDGGDLALYRFIREPAFGGHYARLGDLDRSSVVSYEPNRFMSFVNSPVSIHGVTPRAPSNHVRRYINFIAEVGQDAFSIPKLRGLPNLAFWLKRKASKRKGITLDTAGAAD